MFRHTFKWTMAVIAVGLFLPLSAGAIEFHGHNSGTQFSTNYDANGDGITAASIEGTGRFTHLGKMTSKGMNEMLGLVENPACSEYELGFEPYYFHMVLTAENGDMLFTEQSSGGVCWNFLDSSWWSVHHMQITGGTGRFTGATGQFDCDNAGLPMLTPDSVTIGYSWDANCYGEIELSQ